MTRYVIPKEFHKHLYIFEGGLKHFHIYKNNISIEVSCVDFYEPSLNRRLPEYFETIKIHYKHFSYLKFETGYEIKKKSYDDYVELGKYRQGDDLLEFGGQLSIIGGKFKIPTSWMLEIVCEDIELEFLS